MLRGRLVEAHAQGYLDPETCDEVLAAWTETEHPQRARERMESALARAGAPAAVGVYLTSVVDASTADGRPLSWNEAWRGDACATSVGMLLEDEHDHHDHDHDHHDH